MSDPLIQSLREAVEAKAMWQRAPSLATSNRLSLAWAKLDLQALLDRLRRAEAALPVTADGVRVYPGATVWLRERHGVTELQADVESPEWISLCHSTREAAEKAEPWDKSRAEARS